MARVAVETAVGFEHVYVGTHQGNIGHIIHAHALLTFERLGCDDLVDSVGYWERDLGWDDWASGHAFKYPYARFDLLPLVDEKLATVARRGCSGHAVARSPCSGGRDGFQRAP